MNASHKSHVNVTERKCSKNVLISGFISLKMTGTRETFDLKIHFSFLETQLSGLMFDRDQEGIHQNRIRKPNIKKATV